MCLTCINEQPEITAQQCVVIIACFRLRCSDAVVFTVRRFVSPLSVSPSCFFISSFCHNSTTFSLNNMLSSVAGISRSSTVVAAYLMAWLGLPYLLAIDALKSKRGSAFPNAGFRDQLHE